MVRVSANLAHDCLYFDNLSLQSQFFVNNFSLEQNGMNETFGGLAASAKMAKY